MSDEGKKDLLDLGAAVIAGLIAVLMVVVCCYGDDILEIVKGQS